MTDPTNKQRLLEAVQILADHNKWRRGEDDSSMPARDVSPMLLGQAIDTVVELVPGLVDVPVTDEMVERAAKSYHTLTGWLITLTDSLRRRECARLRSALVAAIGSVKP